MRLRVSRKRGRGHLRREASQDDNAFKSGHSNFEPDSILLFRVYGWKWTPDQVRGDGYRVRGDGYRIMGDGYRVRGDGYRVGGDDCRPGLYAN